MAVPHARRQRFVVCHAVQQQCVGDPVGRHLGLRAPRVIEPRPYQGTDQHRDQQRHHVGHHQPHKPPCPPAALPSQSAPRLPVPGWLRRIAAQHQEDLHRHARVVVQPGHEVRRQRLRDVGHGAIERQVVRDDGCTKPNPWRCPEWQARGNLRHADSEFAGARPQRSGLGR